MHLNSFESGFIWGKKTVAAQLLPSKSRNPAVMSERQSGRTISGYDLLALCQTQCVPAEPKEVK